MRRTALTLLLAATFAAPAAAVEPPALGVKVAACETGLDLADRAAEFSGAMPQAAGSDVLQMRFELEQRRVTMWKPLAVPGFGRWEKSVPGAAGFVYAKRVERLVAGASYRVRVRFRWLDAGGDVVKTATRRSPVCKQPDLRPDLTIVGLTVGDATGPDTSRYLVQVRNAGLGALLQSFRIGLTVNGTPLPPQTLTGLQIAGLGSVAFDAPDCAPGSMVVATADPDDGISEPVESDNALRVPCPA